MHFAAANLRRRREHNDRAWLAHNTARLMHYHHDPKKMPSLRTLLHLEPSRRKQSPDQQLAIVKAIVAAFGGKKGS